MATVSVSEGGEPVSNTFRKEEAVPPETSCLLLPVLFGASVRGLPSKNLKLKLPFYTSALKPIHNGSKNIVRIFMEKKYSVTWKKNYLMLKKEQTWVTAGQPWKSGEKSWETNLVFNQDFIGPRLLACSALEAGKMLLWRWLCLPLSSIQSIKQTPLFLVPRSASNLLVPSD